MFLRLTANRHLRLGEAQVSVLRVVCIAAGLIICLVGTYGALRVGLSRYLAARTPRTGSLVGATRAVRVSPDDPEAYQARARELSKRGEFRLAVEDLREAISLRSGDYKLWSQLGAALNHENETAGAFAAFTEAERLAPFFAGTHWDTGMLLLKLGRRDEAFKEFRSATLNQPDLFTQVIELAWGEYSADCRGIEEAVSPRNSPERLTLARFLMRKGKASDAVSLVREIDDLSGEERYQLVAELVNTKCFVEAYELWAADLRKTSPSEARGAVDDGGFESGEVSEGVGFGWRINQRAAIKPFVDKNESHTGTSSLRIDWGNPATSDEIISQLLLVEPNARYKLNFVARAQNLVTGGAPIITVTDVSQEEQKLGHSLPLPLSTTGWEDRSVEFATTNSTRAVRIGLQRENCSEPICPIFGTLWLDDFSLSQESTSPKSKVPKSRVQTPESRS
jgi:tetratricopeptide (TPR) repeat protein